MVQVPNVSDIGLKPRKMKKVAVIGGGLMGSGIATALILSDHYVILKEINSEYLLKGIKSIEGQLTMDVDLSTNMITYSPVGLRPFLLC